MGCSRKNSIRRGKLLWMSSLGLFLWLLNCYLCIQGDETFSGWETDISERCQVKRGLMKRSEAKLCRRVSYGLQGSAQTYFSVLQLREGLWSSPCCPFPPLLLWEVLTDLSFQLDLCHPAQAFQGFLCTGKRGKLLCPEVQRETCPWNPAFSRLGNLTSCCLHFPLFKNGDNGIPSQERWED